MEVDDESPNHSPTSRSASKAVEDPVSDDVLALQPSCELFSTVQSLPRPHKREEVEEDDDRDELDLISSMSPSPSPPPHQIRKRSKTRSRSHTVIIDIPSSPEPEEVAVKENSGQIVTRAEEGIQDEDDIQDEVISPISPVADQETSTSRVELQDNDQGRVVIDVDSADSAEGHLSVGNQMVIDLDGDDADEQPKPKVESVPLAEEESLEEQSASHIEEPQTTQRVVDDSPKLVLPRDPSEKSDIVMEERVVPSDTVAVASTPSPPQRSLTPPPLIQVTPHRPSLIPAPATMPGFPSYNFQEQPDSASTQTPRPTADRHFAPQYTLPPQKALPIEFHRRGKLMKLQRKREREREKNEKGFEKNDAKKENKEDWVPMGLNRWGATVRANPVWKRVAHASKCLSTREWNVC
jgi:chromatin modification-related protein VID21